MCKRKWLVKYLFIAVLFEDDYDCDYDEDEDDDVDDFGGRV